MNLCEAFFLRVFFYTFLLMVVRCVSDISDLGVVVVVPPLLNKTNKTYLVYRNISLFYLCHTPGCGCKFTLQIVFDLDYLDLSFYLLVLIM